MTKPDTPEQDPQQSSNCKMLGKPLSYLCSFHHYKSRLTDARDGLKPVHRRFLFAMCQFKLTLHRVSKNARVVGDDWSLSPAWRSGSL